MSTTVSPEELYKIIYTDHHDPFQVLGEHIVDLGGKKAVVIRAFLPNAKQAWVTETEGGTSADPEMIRLHPEGFFELLFPGRESIFPYMLKTLAADGAVEVFRDSYAYLPTLTDLDLYLFNMGDHHQIYNKLGAHYAEVSGVGGVQFAVWAPGARSVSVVGNFNHWDRRAHAMRTLGSSGIWEIFIPGLPEGELYKFQVKTTSGVTMDKADPYGTEMEVRPRSGSRVNFLGGYEWRDREWMSRRQTGDLLARPISVYELHLGSWRRGENNEWLGYRELAVSLVDYVTSLGYTHVELMPVMEHPLDASWGYQVTGYFAPTSRFGSPQDFMYFVDYCHEHGIGVLLDWVPAHFPRDGHALAYFDGTHLYEHADPRKGEHQDWGTLIFNYGRHEVKNFLISNALFWADKYHIDGIRIDAVASMLYLDYSRKEGEWVPNQYGGRENLEAIEFLKQLNHVIHATFPGVLMIAEESTAWPGVTTPVEHGGLGFDLKWNMGWMNDMLEYFSKEAVHRSFHHRNLTFALLYAFTERFMLSLSHDEVVHGKGALLRKMPGDDWQKFANLRLLHALMFSFPGKKLLFMGGEFGQWDEWYHEKSLDWHLLNFEPHKGVQRLVQDLHRMYHAEPALFEVDFQYTGFEWIDFHDAANSIIAFERKGLSEKERLIVVLNFTPVVRENYRVGVWEPGGYREILNSDSSVYGGSNKGNSGEVHAEAVPVHGRKYSLSLTLPPLGALFIKRL